jgi:hypothetical protein
MAGISVVGVSDAEIVNDKAEGNVTCFVNPQARGEERHGYIAVGLQENGEVIIGNVPSLWEAIHTFTDLDINMVVMHKGRQVVFGHNQVRNDRNRDGHVFVLVHGCVQIKIFEIACHEAAIGSGDHAIKEDFDCGEVCGFSANITNIIDAVAAKGEVHASGVRFFRTQGSDNAVVGWFLPMGIAETGMKNMVLVRLGMLAP